MKKRKNLLFIVLLLFTFVIGFTLAYYTNRFSKDNVFNVTAYGVTIEKSFEAPDSWSPGDTISYNLNVKNESDIDVAVRVIALPHWRGYVTYGNDGSTREEYFTNHVDAGTYYDYYTGEEVSYEAYDLVVLNLSNNSDWIYEGVDEETGGDIYYYKYPLNSQATTSDLFDSLTFNVEAGRLYCSLEQSSNYGNDNATDLYNSGSRSFNCVTGYKKNYTFVLDLKIQTVQFDAYQEVWNTDVEIN